MRTQPLAKLSRAEEYLKARSECGQSAHACCLGLNVHPNLSPVYSCAYVAVFTALFWAVECFDVFSEEADEAAVIQQFVQFLNTHPSVATAVCLR